MDCQRLAGSLGLQNAFRHRLGTQWLGHAIRDGSNRRRIVLPHHSPFGANASPAHYDLVITDSGNVGIGTTHPQSKLSAQGSGYGVTQTDGAVTVGTYVGAGGGRYGTRPTTPFIFSPTIAVR